MPLAPSSVYIGNSLRRSDFDVDGAQSIVVVAGRSPKSMCVSGSLWVSGYTKAQLETAYLQPLEALQGTEVLVAFPDTRYNGYWVVISFTYTETSEGTLKRFNYQMQLVQGSDALIL